MKEELVLFKSFKCLLFFFYSFMGPRDYSPLSKFQLHGFLIAFLSKEEINSPSHYQILMIRIFNTFSIIQLLTGSSNNSCFVLLDKLYF